MAYLICLLERSIEEHALQHFEKFYKTILIKTVTETLSYSKDEVFILTKPRGWKLDRD